MKKIIFILNVMAYVLIFNGILAMKTQKPTWDDFHANNQILIQYKQYSKAENDEALQFMEKLATSNYDRLSLKARIALGSHYIIVARTGGAGSDTYYREKAISWLLPVANQDEYQEDKFLASYQLGSIYQNLGDKEQAKKWYEVAVKIDVQDLSLKFDKTKALQELKKLQYQEDTFKELKKRQSKK